MALCLFSARAIADQIVTAEHDGFSVVHLASLPDPAVDEVTRQVASAITRVSAWLGQSDEWHNANADASIRVLIDPDRFTPTQMKTTIFVPENRLRKALETDTLAASDLGIVHEITHVLAASAYRNERNRFYDDGLAVYLQHRLGPKSNYPTFGIDIHVALAAAVATGGDFVALADADQVRRSNESEPRRLGYLTVGSFTQYLIENYGIDAYFRIYNGASIDEVTGKTLLQLEQRWRTLIQSL